MFWSGLESFEIALASDLNARGHEPHTGCILNKTAKARDTRAAAIQFGTGRWTVVTAVTR
jgi:hypothetical protein